MKVRYETCDVTRNISEAEIYLKQKAQNAQAIEEMIVARQNIDGSVSIPATGATYSGRETFLAAPGAHKGRWVAFRVDSGDIRAQTEGVLGGFGVIFEALFYSA